MIILTINNINYSDDNNTGEKILKLVESIRKVTLRANVLLQQHQDNKSNNNNNNNNNNVDEWGEQETTRIWRS